MFAMRRDGSPAVGRLQLSLCPAHTIYLLPCARVGFFKKRKTGVEEEGCTKANKNLPLTCKTYTEKNSFVNVEFG